MIRELGVGVFGSIFFDMLGGWCRLGWGFSLVVGRGVCIGYFRVVWVFWCDGGFGVIGVLYGGFKDECFR